MTNGEKLEQVFPDGICPFSKSWLDYEYKEPTTKNNLAVEKIVDVLGSYTDLDIPYKSEIAENILTKLSSVTPQEPRWISVSERLPEDRREVLVTAYWHETYQVMMASYYGDGLWWCVPFNNCGEHMQRLKPKAWMPLPHKAESEG